MRLSKEIYEERLLQIAGAYLRMRDRRKMSHEQIPVDYFVRQYGFTKNFSRVERLSKALSDMYIWINKERERTSWTPSADRIVNFLKVHIGCVLSSHSTWYCSVMLTGLFDSAGSYQTIIK